MEKHDFKTSFQSKICIDNDIIFCDYNNDNFHQITKKEIVVIGIHTNWNGPNFKYSYVDFVTDNSQWFWMPLYADNADKVVDYLHEQFQINFRQTLLTVSDEWNSVVIYPKYLEGKPLFKVLPTENYKEPKTSFDRMLARVGLGGFNTITTIDLTDEVRSEMTNASR